MPPRQRVVGHASVLAKDPLRTLVRWMQSYGPVVRFQIGSRDAHVVFGVDEIRRVLSDPDDLYGKQTFGYDTLRLFLGDGLLTSEGAKWSRQRKILQPAFHRQSIGRHLALMNEVAERTASELAASKEPVRIDELTMRVTLEIVTRGLFGTDLQSQADEVARAITDLQHAANERISAAISLPFGLPTPGHLRIRLARFRLRRILQRVVDERLVRGVQNDPDVLDLLLGARTEDGRPLPKESILDELVTMLIAGHESTGSSIAWALVLLANHRAELAMLRAELDAARDALGYEQLGKLTRLRAVVDETLRLFPAAWSFGRAPRRDDQLAGYTVPQGHLVMLVPWATHRDPRLFPNPEAFDPSRFLGPPPPSFSYLPFGAGPHSCIGSQFARAEAQIVLATWLRRLDFEIVPGQNLEPLPLITLRPRDGAYFRVTRRKAS